jgi:hypothetical protein
MAVNNVNYNDSLREGTDKINQSIDQSNQAIDKANSADTKADSAISTANQANEKSDDTQQQINNLVINNGESDAEVLQARGTYPVLNERLSATDEQLADIMPDVSKLVSGETQDASVSIQAVINIAQTNKAKRVKFPKSTYRLNNLLSITGDDLELDFSGSTLLNYAKASGNQQGETGMINILGSLVGDQNLVTYYRSLPQGTTHLPPSEAPILLTFENYTDWSSDPRKIGGRITTSNNDYFSVGDEVLLMGWTRPTGFPYNKDMYEPQLRKVVTVVSKDANYIYVDYHSPFEYPAFVDNDSFKSRAIKVNAVKNVTIRNVIIKDMTTFAVENNPTSTEQQEALSLIYNGLTKNLLLDNVRTEKQKYPAIYTMFARDIKYKDCYAENPQWWVGGKGYLTQVIGSRDIRMNDIKGKGTRHLIDFSWSSNAEVDNAFQTNGRASDFGCHGLNEHDITLKRCKGELILGNNIELFPNMVENINIFDSHINLRTNPADDKSYVKNLYVENSELDLTLAPIGNVFTFKGCKINWHFNGSRIQPNKRGKNFITKGVFDNCIIKLMNNLMSDSYRITLEQYDEIVFKDVNFEWGFDPLQFSTIRNLNLWSNKKITFDNVRFNQLALEIRNSTQAVSELRLNNVDAEYVNQSGAAFLSVYSLTSNTLNVGITNTKVYSPNSIYVWTLRTTGMTNSTILANVSNNKFLSDTSGGTRFPKPASNPEVLTLHVADSNNLIKNKENVAGFDTNKNIFI